MYVYAYTVHFCFVFYWDTVVGVAEVYKQGCTSFFVVFPITPKETATVKHMFLLSLLLLSLSLFSAEIKGKVVAVTDGGCPPPAGKYRAR